MNADGTQKTLLTSAFGYDGQSPGWSPDGHQIVFRTDNGIYVIKDGIQLRQLLSIDMPRGAGHLAWSPDGTRIVFSASQGQITMINADGTGLTLLTARGSNLMPTWSPDGARIAFCSGRDGNNEIYVMNADGSGQTNITNNPASDCDPAWGPVDGTMLTSTPQKTATPAPSPTPTKKPTMTQTSTNPPVPILHN